MTIGALAGPISEQPVTPSINASIDQTAQQQQQPSPTPLIPGSTAGGTYGTLKGINTSLATTIAKAIALGLTQAPSSEAGWAQLMDKFSTDAGRNAVTQQEQNLQNAKPGATPQTPTAAPAGSSGGPGGLNAFLAAIRQHESSGNYKAYNAGGGASGAYQFIQSTWSSQAREAGYGQYAGQPAGDAPPQVQDAVAAHMAQGYFQHYGNWADVAEAWYDPALVGQNVVPAPGAGNTETVTAYGNQIVQMMGQMGHYTDPGTPAAGASNNIVKIAQGQIGVPYVWGGESAGKAFDCSGLVQWVFGQAGETLPRTAQQQYDATPKIQAGAQLQPGDLLFFGSGGKGVEHVGIYIGNGQMINAPHTGADVRVDQVFDQNGRPLWGNFVGATRPADPTGMTTAAAGNPIQKNIQGGQDNFGSILQRVFAEMTKQAQTEPLKRAPGTMIQ